MKKMQYEVTICEVENGFVVRVGCKLFAFANYEEMEMELRAYAHGEKTELTARIEKETPTCEGGPPQEAMPDPPSSRSVRDGLARG